MLKTLTPNLMVEDVEATIKFYQDLLNFELTNSVPGPSGLQWASLRSGEVELMFQQRASLEEELPVFAHRPIGGSLTFYIGVDDVTSLYEKLQPGAKLAADLHTTFYGSQEFAVLDNNGYVLVFSAAAPVPTA